MRKISLFLTILITSFVMALAGLVASPIATASENGNGSISATFPLGSSVLSNAQKAAIKKALASSGSDVSFTVTGTAGKLPGISDRWVQRLAKKRAQAIKAYIVSLGVSTANVTTQTKITEIGIVPKSTGSQPTSASTVAVTTSTGTGSGSSSGGGGSTAIAPGAPTGVSATVASGSSVVSWTAPTVGTAVTSYTVTSTPGITSCIVSSTSCTLTPLTNGTAYTITVTATNSAGTGPASTGISVTPAAPSCAAGGTCVAGDIGPGGGKVFYVHATTFSCGQPLVTTCKYLEVAPLAWSPTGTSGDTARPWAVTGNTSADVDGITGGGGGVAIPNEASTAINTADALGDGLANSNAIVSQNGSYDPTSNNYAAGAARAYTGGSKSDWYLPTAAELNLLYYWNRGITQNVSAKVNTGLVNAGTDVGALFFMTSVGSYWSSSEHTIISTAWAHTNGDFATYQVGSAKSGSLNVRPIRAF